MRSSSGFLLCLFAVLFFDFLTSSAQPLGQTYVAGHTWFDLQHESSVGRTIAFDDMDASVHLVWTKGLAADPTSPRHVFYNHWTSGTGFPDSVGVQVDEDLLAFNASVGMFPGGCQIIAFENMPLGPYGPALSLCGSSSHYLPVPIGYHGFSPQLAIGSSDSTVYLLSLFRTGDGPIRIGYSWGLIQVDQYGTPSGIEWHQFGQDYVDFLDTVYTASHAIASGYAESSQGWLHSRDGSQYNNDVYFHQWSGTHGNITSWYEPDWECALGDTMTCNRDTFRVYSDLSLLMDHSDWTHAAFTTIGYYALNQAITVAQSEIWHWDQADDQYSLIADGWVNVPSPGAGQRIVQRPSLCEDPITWRLFCAYQRYDTATYSESGYPGADIYVSVSTNRGRDWSVGVNVTRTTPQGHPVPAGQSLSECEPSLAEHVLYEEGEGYLILSYMLDHDAGNSARGEGVATLNEIIYQRVPVDSIPYFPLMARRAMHFDSTGFPRDLGAVDERPAPLSFALYPAYPNPFNSITQVRFDLPARMNVSLKVYDLLGREVADLQNGFADAGAHSISWDAHSFSSGLYFVRLSAGSTAKTQKLMLLK